VAGRRRGACLWRTRRDGVRVRPDFSAVRIHEGSVAQRLSERIRPGVHGRQRRLLPRRPATDTSTAAGSSFAHELTHTVQQGGAAMRTTATYSRGTRPLRFGVAPNVQRVFDVGQHRLDFGDADRASDGGIGGVLFIRTARLGWSSSPACAARGGGQWFCMASSPRTRRKASGHRRPSRRIATNADVLGIQQKRSSTSIPSRPQADQNNRLVRLRGSCRRHHPHPRTRGAALEVVQRGDDRSGRGRRPPGEEDKAKKDQPPEGPPQSAVAGQTLGRAAAMDIFTGNATASSGKANLENLSSTPRPRLSR